ncbi:MAG: glycosyltransferase family 39 protein [Candidatus Microgenomates bacterium]|jgi:4-amino-4-deoxy-L-arabinose transferase-like glycosyltransferase
MKRIEIIFLSVIVVIAAVIRFIAITSIPPSLDWDEASVGYDAYSILQTGKDQWGKIFPIVFQSFGEFKYPIHIYFTALTTWIFGYGTFSVRVGSAFFGVINIVLLFFLVWILTKSKTVAFTASLLMAFSPWAIQFSRVNWETNFGLFFFFLGIIYFFKGLEKKRWFIPLSFLLFGIDLFTYNAAKVFIPLFVFALVVIYWKDLLQNKFYSIIGALIFFGFILVNVFQPDLSGIGRLGQVVFPDSEIKSTYLYKLTKHEKVGMLQLVAQNYLFHFTPQFLFISGDSNPRHSIQTVGELYWFDAILLPIGFYYIIRNNKKWSWLLLVWFFLAPIPASIATEAPHASRTMFAIGGWQVVSTLGFCWLLDLAKKLKFQLWFVTISTLVFLLFTENYLFKYFGAYSVNYSSDWQYGYMKIFTGYKNDFGRYNHIVVSDQDGQPYIFALFYLKYNPDLFRETVVYNPENDWGASTVKSFDKFVFKKVENSDLQKNTLIFATPMDMITNATPLGVIRNLDGSVAFWVYSK